MRKPGGKKPTLVAPKRTFATSEAKPARKAKPAKVRGRRSRKVKKPPRNIFVALIAWLFRKLFGLVWWVGIRSIWVGVAVVGVSTAYFYVQLPPAEDQVDGRSRGSVTMLDRTGKVFSWRGKQFGGLIRVETVSPFLKNAVVATEDKRFYSHFGISPRGIASAIRINLQEGRGPLQGNGGSTITQQVAKILCLGNNYDPTSGMSEREFERDCRQTTMLRKLKEVPYSLAMELKYGKDAILMIYLNRAYLGAGAQGFQAASQRYFGKNAIDVNASESAMLAGLLVAPSYFAPTRDLERSQDRASVILGLMADQGYLTDLELAESRANPAQLSEAAEDVSGGYFTDWVMDLVPPFLVKDITEDLVVKTTFDSEIQAAAEDAVATIFGRLKEGSNVQTAVVVMSADGAVRAMVGGREQNRAGQFNRAVQAKRQTGSSFKPFVYATALDLGYRFDSIVEDAPITINIPGSGPWSPENYSGKFLGPITLTMALSYSINTAAVRVSEDVGRDLVRKVAQDFGVKSELATGPALALGASESTLLEMTGAYAGILNGGTSVSPYGLIELSLQGDAEPLMGKSGGLGERVISENAARQLVYMMNQVAETGSGRRALLPDRKIGAKTGTTSAARDAWFIGYTADYVAGVWMGYDDNSKLTGVTGGGLPAEIWRETMLKVIEGTEPRPLPMIDPVAEASQAPTVKEPDARDPAQNILDQVLGAIFGSN
jgi:membrane peptidoglycan carboxypeptidase